MDGGAAEKSLNAVVQDLALRMGQPGQSRLGAAFFTVVSRIHDIVTDLQPSAEELKAAIDFLTDVGHSADARCQEWVLLADVIGVSTRIEDLTWPCPDRATPNTFPGPFYRDDMPDRPLGADLCLDGFGESLRVQLCLTDLRGQPLPDAQVEVWHANPNGRYENQEPDLQPEFNLRGRFRADARGRVEFLTVKPAGYALPADGPVGRLLTTLGLPPQRPAHMHFRVTCPGARTLTTHVFDRNDPAIGRDAVFGVRPGLLADFRQLPADAGGPMHALDLTLVLVPAGQAEDGRLRDASPLQKEH